MPSYEQIQLIGGPCDGETHSWDGGDYFVFRRLYTVARHTYVRSRDDKGNRTTRFIYQGDIL